MQHRRQALGQAASPIAQIRALSPEKKSKCCALLALPISYLVAQAIMRNKV